MSAPCKRLPGSVSDVSATYPKDDVFGDISCVVCYSFQIARDGEDIQRLRGSMRLRLHEPRYGGEGFAINAVHLVIALEDVLRQLRIRLDKCSERIADHVTDQSSHGRNIYRQLDGGLF